MADIFKHLLVAAFAAIIVWFGLPALGIAITFTQAVVFTIVIQTLVILVVSAASLADEGEGVQVIVMQTVNDDKEDGE